MHEYSIVSALLDRVESEARGRSATAVRRVEIRIGELSGVEPDLLAAAWTTFREKTLCDRAELDIRRVAVRWVCPKCGSVLGGGAALRCEPCGAEGRLAGGDELMLDRIEMEVP